uniref:Uncharacterized protein n=1 Tax=Rhizophagus irregularis (strain DAOM 181602 / DAOM 197198 / MUCL 43194) TaxID=747089 RepID=U9SHD3_RHIID
MSDISRLTNTQIQNIIDYMNDQQVHKTITIDNDQNHMTLAETISSATSQTKFSSENFDYYGIINDTSCGLKRTCSLLCSLDHDDEESIEDKIRSKLYKRYKKETGNEPWQLSEVHESEVINSPENKVSDLSFPSSVSNVKKKGLSLSKLDPIQN